MRNEEIFEYLIIIEKTLIKKYKLVGDILKIMKDIGDNVLIELCLIRQNY